MKTENKAFTLIELLVVIAIIALLATIVIASLNCARKKARDARRLADIKEIQKAIEMYYDDHGRYPSPGENNCAGWDTGNTEHDILPGRLDEYLRKVPADPSATGNCNGYRYYRYPAGYKGCDPNKGAFYVLEITDMETSGRPHPKSPGFKCPDRDWGTEADYVVGKFENF